VSRPVEVLVNLAVFAQCGRGGGVASPSRCGGLQLVAVKLQHGCFFYVKEKRL
jgi:hypothetical protein